MIRPRPFTTLSILGLLVVALGACSSGSSPSAGASSQAAAASQPAASDAPSEAAAEATEVRITSSNFSPAELTVAVGTEVVFINDDSFGHTVTEGTDGDVVEDPIVDEDIAGGGGEVRVTFDEAGTFDITCEIHPAMQLTVTVEG